MKKKKIKIIGNRALEKDFDEAFKEANADKKRLWRTAYLMVLCFVLGVSIGAIVAAKTVPTAIWRRGYDAGVLVVINYDRKSEGQKPFASMDEFMSYLDNSKDDENRMNKFFQELDEQNKLKAQYPIRPWVDK